MLFRIKNVFILLFLITLVSCAAPVKRSGPQARSSAPRAQQDDSPTIAKIEGLRKRIWVLDFRVSAPIPEAMNRIDFRNIFRESLNETFLNHENSAFVPVVSDQTTLEDLQIDSSTPSLDVSKVARGSGIAGFLKGDIFEINYSEKRDPKGLIQSRQIELQIGFRYELLDAATGRSLVSGTRRRTYTETRSDIMGYASGLADAERKIRNMANMMSLWALNDLNPHSAKVGWSGRVLKLEGSRIYVNAGRSSGLQVGDILKVVEAPRDVYDPQSGRFIGQAPGRVKGTCKVVEYFGLDGAVAMLQSGGGLLPGDRVEIF